MSENQKQKLKNGNYYIKIKTEKKIGNLNYGEAKLKGNSNKIFLLTTFLCHPSMANNELSGPLTLIGLYNNISKWKNRNLNYNFLIHPETIGSIVYIKKNLSTLKNKVHSGSVLTCMGGHYKNLSYFKSRNSKSPLDRLIEYFAKQNKFKIYNFDPSEGGDERQFCGGEVNLPIGRLERNGKGHFKEYHTDLDKKNIMKINKITNSVESLSYILEYNDYMFPILRYEKYCELFMSKRNLYPETNDFINTFKKDKDLNHKIIVTLLSYADGKVDYLDIVNLYKFPIENVLNCLKFLIKIKLIYLKL
jgi:aminopeptidase-like protein